MNNLKGTGVALITPFKEDRSIDFDSLKRVIDFVIKGHVDYIVVMGTTAESPTISWSDQLEVLSFTINHINNRLPVVFGLGGNDTFSLCEKSQELEEYKISAILSASPYYNRPSQKGIIAHYEAIADSSPFPIILYNVPARTASNIEINTSIELSKHENIFGLKEASGDLDQFQKIKNQVSEDFLMLSGNDCNTLDCIKVGGHGIISVVANLIPEKFSEMVRVALAGDFTKATTLDNALKTVYDLSNNEGNPTSIKTGMKCLGLIENHMRLPLIEGSEHLEQAFRKYLA